MQLDPDMRKCVPSDLITFCGVQNIAKQVLERIRGCLQERGVKHFLACLHVVWVLQAGKGVVAAFVDGGVYSELFREYWGWVQGADDKAEATGFEYCAYEIINTVIR